MGQQHTLGRRAAAEGSAGPEFKLLIEHSADGILVIDENGLIVFANPAAEEMFSRSAEDLIGSPIGMPMIAGETTAISLLRPGGTTIEAEIRVVETDWRGQSARLASLRDVTTRRIAEERLRQAQKMEAVGQLTAGIAHDFNNLLTVATGTLELLRDGEPGGPATTQKRIDAVLAALARAERLTAQLLAFSRKQRLEPAPLDLNRVLLDMEDLLRRAVGPRVELGFTLGTGLPPALADRNQLETALLNIAANARDAMPEGGRFTLATGIGAIGRDDLRAPPDAETGRYLTLAASDTGIGMPPEVLRRAFEPFFSTKGPGKGTGLGLAMVYGFVRQSGGHVQIDSRPAKGTRVTLYLPFAPAPPRDPVPAAAPAALERGSETVLVVEDESAVRDLAGAMLRDLGYTVVEAADGDTALQILAARRDIDAVFSDLIMPGAAGGLDIAREILQNRPDLAVVLTSGYASSYSDPDGLLARVEFVQKPYRQADLAGSLRKALDRRVPRPSRGV
ncbi:MAG TPA: ATP-binding protein [Stellaceae bacterium]|nr:ATP-binding protein [Stellaceae bacterium]